MTNTHDDIKDFIVEYLRETERTDYLTFIEAISNRFSHLGENRGWLIMTIKNELETQGIILHDKASRMIRMNKKSDKKRKPLYGL